MKKFFQGVRKYATIALGWTIIRSKKLMSSPQPAKRPVRPIKRSVGVYGRIVAVMILLTIIGLKLAFDGIEWTFHLPGMSTVATVLALLFVALLVYALATKPELRKKCADNWKPALNALAVLAFIGGWLWIGKGIHDRLEESERRDIAEANAKAQEHRELCAKNRFALVCTPVDSTYESLITASKQVVEVVPLGHDMNWVYDTLRVEKPAIKRSRTNQLVYFRLKPGVDTATVEIHLFRSS